LYLKRADVDPTVNHSVKTGPALIGERRRSEVRVASVNSRATGQKLVRERWTAIVLQWAQQRISVDLIVGTSQETATIITAEIVTVRDDRA
jgi:hypothetical protein